VFPRAKLARYLRYAVLDLYTILPDDAEEYVVRRMGIIGLAMSLAAIQTHFALAVVSRPAPELVERGYTHLAQARAEADSATRERLLNAAIAAFKGAYQAEPPEPPSQAQALLGAAQAYLLVQSPRRVFPFLWQATPLQRAAKSLQQALARQPDNAAAALLLGVVYWRQATQAAEPQHDVLERSQYYLAHAAALGLPIAFTSSRDRQASPVKWFSVDDTIMALCYVDARGVGRMEDLLFVYRSPASAPLYGVVVTGRQAHPLTLDTATGALVPDGLLESITTTPQPGQQSILALRVRQGTLAQDLRFTWDGTRFVPLSALPSR